MINHWHTFKNFIEVKAFYYFSIVLLSACDFGIIISDLLYILHLAESNEFKVMYKQNGSN